MIQTTALLVAGLAAAGIVLTDSFRLLVACWVLGAVMQAGLVASSGRTALRDAAREVFLVELFGVWVLLMAGLDLVLATGATDLAAVQPVSAAGAGPGWAGVGVLLVVTSRLGLPPLAPWQTRLAAASPTVRVFLHAALQPATAIVLWWRLDAWLLPWHRDLALWIAVVVALGATAAAAGERLPPRRAALLTVAAWAALLARGAPGGDLPALRLLATAGGAALLHLAAATPRWPRPRRRGLLTVAALALVLAGTPFGDPFAASPTPSAAGGRLAAALAAAGMVAIIVHWWVAAAPAHAAALAPRRAAIPALAALARRSRERGPLIDGARGTGRWLSRVVAVADRLVLAGIVDGLALIGLGVGWLVAWYDRRGFDAVERGLATLVLGAGRVTRLIVATQPAWILFWAGVLVLLLTLTGGLSA